MVFRLVSSVGDGGPRDGGIGPRWELSKGDGEQKDRGLSEKRGLGSDKGYSRAR